MILNEPSTEGIAAYLNKRKVFKLSIRPEDMAIRSVIRETGVILRTCSAYL